MEKEDQTLHKFLTCQFKIPKLNRCCFCFKLTTGCIILAVLQLFEQAYKLEVDLVNLMRAGDEMPKANLIVQLVINSVVFLCIFLLLIGLLFNSSTLMLPLLWFHACYIILLLTGGIYYAFTMSWSTGLMACFNLAFHLYLWVCMQSSYRIIKENELHQAIGVDIII